MPLAAADPVEVEALLDAAFGADRQRRTAYRLREGPAPVAGLSFAAFAEATLVGMVQTWAIELTSADVPPAPLLLVGPVGVAPDRQREGIGTALVTRALAAIDAAGEHAAALIGDAEYYGRFGFAAAPTQAWELPGPFERHRLLVRLTRGATLPAHGELRSPCALQVARRMV